MYDEGGERAALFLEDFVLGRQFGSGAVAVEADAVRRFNAEFDPGAMFGSAEDTGEPTVSGWHVASLTMRLLVESELRPAGGIMGGGTEGLRWPTPVRTGDVLHLRSEVLEARASRSRPQQGVVRLRTETLNQHEQTVQVFVSSLMVRRRA